MAGLFDAVVGADAVSAIKPDAAHLIEAVAAMGGDLARNVMVGDAATDAGSSRAAGMPLILVDDSGRRTRARHPAPSFRRPGGRLRPLARSQLV